MTTAVIKGFADLAVLEDTAIFVSGPVLVSQDDINRFAELTGDHNPIHVDQAYCQAGRGLPGVYTTIAHGMFTASIAVATMQANLTVAGHDVYVRGQETKWSAPVPAGSNLVIEVVMTDRIKDLPRQNRFEFWVRCNVYTQQDDGSRKLAAVVETHILASKREQSE